MSISLTSYGAAGEVTGSKHLLSINDEKYLIDCGAWQGNQEANQRNKDFTLPDTDKLSGVFLTHAHFDHSGLLPKLVKDGYKGKIYSTPATRDLASIILLDSAKIQKYEKPAPAYNEQDVVNTMDYFRCHYYHKKKYVNDNLTFTFYDAGHILGSSMIDIEIPKKKSLLRKLLKKENKKLHILFTGDLGRKSNPITNEPETCMPAPDYIVMESTYGNRTHQSSEVCYTQLEEIINKTIERGGKVIIPSFAIERAQEIIYNIKLLMRDKKIPKVPVYVDSPMATAATGVFNIHPECFNKKIVEQFVSQGKNPFSVRSLHCITDFKDSQRIAKTDKPYIVIAANGMCEAGRVINHLKTGLSNPKNTIVVVGYMAENTLGRRILNQEPVVQIEDEDYDLKAEVVSIDGFSAHADYNEMFRWLRDIDKSKLKKIILVHGDSEAQTALKAFLETNGYNVQIAVAEKLIALN